jgi:hypothetical protein
VFVFERPRDLAGAAPVLAPGLLEHRCRLHRQLEALAQLGGAIEHWPGARVVAQHVQPGEADQRGHVRLDHVDRGGLVVADARAPQAVGAVLVVGERAIDVARLVVLAERAVDDAEQQRLVGLGGDAQRVVVGALLEFVLPAHAREPGLRELQVDAGARVGHLGAECFDQQVGLGLVGERDAMTLQHGDEACRIAGVAQVPERTGAVGRDQTRGCLPSVPGTARGGIGPAQPGRKLVDHRLAQRQPLRPRPGRLAQQLGDAALALVEVAVVGARADRPEPAQATGGRLVGTAVVAVAERRHGREAELTQDRQHGPPAGAVEPGFARDRREGVGAVGSQLGHGPAQEQREGGRLRCRVAQGISGAAEHGRKCPLGQPARDPPVVAPPVVERAGLVGGEGAVDDHLRNRERRRAGGFVSR